MKKENDNSQSDSPLIHMDFYTATTNGNIDLRDICFTLMPGECHGIIGIQSFGLQNFVNSLCDPPKKYMGQFDFLGKTVSKRKPNWSEIMVISNSEDSISFFSAEENIFIHKKSIFGLKRENIISCQKILKELGLQLNLEKPVSDMSFSEKKLLDILRVCVCLPRIAVFCDTYNWLEHSSAIQLPVIIRWLKEKGVSIIYVCQNIEMGMVFSDRISVFDQDSIQQTFDINEVKEDPGKIIQQFSDLRTLYETPDDVSKIPHVLKHILKARDISISELTLNRRLNFLAEDMAKAFDSNGAIIYFVDIANNEMLEKICSSENVQSCSFIRQEQVFSLCADTQFQIYDFSKSAKSLFFEQRNQLKHMLVYSFSVDSNTVGLIQILYAKRHYPNYRFEEYLKLFAKEICIAMDNSRLLGRSVLLQESHHRIKNNLQIVSNLLFLQKNANPAIEDVFTAAIKRINTIASIHDLLCHDGSGKNIINLRTVFQEICKLYRATQLNIDIQMDNISIPYDKATSIALLVNELISNTLKHAFVNCKREDYRAFVQCFNDGNKITFQYSDNGSGIDSKNFSKSKGIGVSIIENMSLEMGASIYSYSDNGYHFKMEIPRNRIMAVNAVEQRF
ncbi:hypothetical protein NE562_10625 [Butyricicoccus faecihominis]|uniref:histidine kinase dimerization/phosphoacceptor domain -containing protein n=1 Tax=Butyricicoccus faecihominis TaxID=1712515 RepID=UPI00247961A3|nr:histidine kinase dimerization/phosphoacceptor domain -containing protein [Butyricicoccus faecihominis]MCQ5130116.1 hypothetical protein [Butyricicoccus faecihominis]